MEENIKAAKTLVIFDFDGVLHPDTEKTIKRHLAVAKEMGLPLTQEVLVYHWGHVYVSVLIPTIAKEMGWPEGIHKEFIKIILSSDASDNNGNPYPEVKLQLASLEDVDKTILSSREKDTLDILLDKLEIGGKFMYIQSADCCPHHKPSRESFLPTLEFIKDKNYDRIFYVGDTIKFDYAAIRDHFPEITFIGVESILVSREGFRQAGVKHVVSNIDEIAVLIKNNSLI